MIDEQGYLEVTDLTSSADEYVFSGGSGLPSLDTNNYHGFRFALCPVFADGKLARTYIESSCVNGCYSPNTGRKVPGETGHDETIIGGDPASSKGGAYARVVSTTRQVDHGLELSLSDTVNMAGFQAGDDIMLTVVSEKSGRCTVSPFPSVGPGMVSVARVTKVQTAPDKLFISSGTFLDGIDVADLGSTADSGVNHCYVMATRIIEFGDLTIDDTRELYADPLTISTAGGVLALRVSGTLDMGANALLNASEKGYNGGNYSPGGGVAGFASTVSSHTGGNEFTAPDGGGGGGSSFGRGGDSSVSAGNTFGSNFDYAALLFGGGGGAGKETSVSKDGGDGAGSVYVVANKVQVSGSGAPGYILANGGNGTTAATGGGGGGGAGGSVNLYMRSLSSVLSQPLQLSAAGGNGGAGATNGGVGGGGYVYMDYCSGGVSAANYITDVSKGATGSSTSATDGQVQIRTDSHFCEN